MLSNLVFLSFLYLLYIVPLSSSLFGVLLLTSPIPSGYSLFFSFVLFFRHCIYTQQPFDVVAWVLVDKRASISWI